MSPTLIFLLCIVWPINLVIISACDGVTCCDDSDCDGGYCKGEGFGCTCKKDWSPIALNNGQCATLLSDGSSVNFDIGDLGYEYSKCEAGNGTCGYCGDGNIPLDGKCSEDQHCADNAYCYFNNFGITAGCIGTCYAKKANGNSCPVTLSEGGVDSACISGKCHFNLHHKEYSCEGGNYTDCNSTDSNSTDCNRTDYNGIDSNNMAWFFVSLTSSLVWSLLYW